MTTDPTEEEKTVNAKAIPTVSHNLLHTIQDIRYCPFNDYAKAVISYNHNFVSTYSSMPISM